MNYMKNQKNTINLIKKLLMKNEIKFVYVNVEKRTYIITDQII